VRRVHMSFRINKIMWYGRF